MKTERFYEQPKLSVLWDVVANWYCCGSADGLVGMGYSYRGRCYSDEFVTGHSVRSSTSSLRAVSSDKLPAYSCVSRLNSSQALQDSSRRPLASRNVPQMLPVRQLAQHGVFEFIRQLVCWFSLLLTFCFTFSFRSHYCLVRPTFKLVSTCWNELQSRYVGSW